MKTINPPPRSPLVNAMVETMAAELKRQFDNSEGVGWYSDARNAKGELDYIAIDGNADLDKIAQALIDQFNVTPKES